MKHTCVANRPMQGRRLLVAAAMVATALVAAMALAACGRDREEEPTATPPPAAAAPTATVAATATTAPAQAVVLPTNTPAPAAPPADQPSADRSAIASPDEVLTAYRARGALQIESTLEDGTVTTEDMQFEMAHVKVDNQYGFDQSYRMVDNSADGGAEPLAVEFYQVGDQIAMNSGDEWMTLSRSQGGAFAAATDIWLSSTQGFGQFMGQAQQVGSETINGVPATHYRFDNADMYRIFTQQMEEQTGIQIDDAHADVWLAEDGNYVVKYSTSALLSNVTVFDDALNEKKARQAVDMTMELYDTNGAVEVTWPAQAPAPGVAQVPGFAPGEFPTPPETEMTTNIIGMPELVSQLSQDEVLAFYRDTLTGLGWSFAGDYGVYTAAKAGSTLNFVFSADPATGATKVSVYGE